MIRSFLFLTLIIFNYACLAQRPAAHSFLLANTPGKVETNETLREKTTLTGGIWTLSNILSSDTLVIYKAGIKDSGYLTGTNLYNDMGFAERYQISSIDSSVSVIGVITNFTGVVNRTSNKIVTLKIWDESVPVMITANLFYSGFPNNLIDSFNVPVTGLGINPAHDTLKPFLFSDTTVKLSMPFFAGYTFNYNFNNLNGDTIGLYSSKNNERNGATYRIDTNHITVGGIVDTLYDTVIYVQNATLWSDNNWHDNYTNNDSLLNNLAIYPIIISHNPTGVMNIQKDELTLSGVFPNPANDYTDLKYAIAGGSDVSIQLLQMDGKIIRTINLPSVSTGEQSIRISTTELPVGNYLYVIHTSAGIGFAGKLTVKR